MLIPLNALIILSIKDEQKHYQEAICDSWLSMRKQAIIKTMLFWSNPYL